MPDLEGSARARRPDRTGWRRERSAGSRRFSRRAARRPYASPKMENAYALLTNIQGFDSFSLGPTSSPEEIARAFQTQVRPHAMPYAHGGSGGGGREAFGA